MKIVILIVSLIALALAICGIKKENTVLATAGQCLGVVVLFLMLQELGCAPTL